MRNIESLLKVIKWVQQIWHWLSSWKFKRIFGKDAGEEYHIIYKINHVPNRSVIFLSYKPKFKRERYSSSTNLTTINSCAETRAIGHLVYAFGEKVYKQPVITSDFDADDRMDISFISLGGVTNLKTCDLLEDVSNFLEYSGDSIKGPSTLVAANQNIDFAFIIKIHPKSNPERTWLCCAGVGEWGTSGAAWYLSRHWKKIHKWAKNKSFAIITETRRGSDESTLSVHRFLRNGKAGEFTKLS